MASLKLSDAVTVPATALLSLALLTGCTGRGSGPAPAADTAGAATTVTADTAAADTAADMAAKPDTGGEVAVSPADTAASRAAVAARGEQGRRDTARVETAESTGSAAVPAPAPRPEQQDTSTATGQPRDTATTQTADAPLRDAYHQAPRDTVSEEVYDGWKQYNLNCARCHGEDVLGTTIAPHLIASLKPEGPINTKPLFVQTVCAGRPELGMPAWCALGMEMPTIDKIYQYVKARSDGKVGPGRPARKEG